MMATATDTTPIDPKTGKDESSTTNEGLGQIEVKFGGNTYHFRQQGDQYIPEKVTDANGKTISPSSRDEAEAWSKLAPTTAGGGGVLGALADVGSSVGHAAKSVYDRWHQGLEDSGFPGIKELAKVAPGTYQTPADKAATVQAQQKAEEKAAAKKAGLADKKKTAAAKPAESPYEELANQQAQMYLQEIAQIAPQATGQNLWGSTGETAQAIDNSMKELTASGSPTVAAPGGGSVGNWLQQQLGSEQDAANDAGLPKAMAAQGQAMVEDAPAFAQGIENTGLANAQYLAAAPYQQLLQELANETAYKAASSTGAGAFGATTANTPAWLQQIFTNLQLPVPPASTKGGTTSLLPGASAIPSAAPATATTPTGNSAANPGAG